MRPVDDPPGPPLLVLPIASRTWPDGDVDLRGRAWSRGLGPAA